MRFEPSPRGVIAANLSATAPSFARPPFAGSPGERAAKTAPVRRLNGWDICGMLAGFLLTLAITWVNSRGRLFWEDEMLGWLLLRDPSWIHMIHAWNLGADGGGFSFYILGRAWFRLFGDSALAFRMFSSTCFGLGFVFLWAALRRFFPVWIVAFAAANTIFFSPPLTMHFIEGRFYGLLVMSTALVLWLAFVLDDAPDPLPLRLYLAAFLAHGLLTTSHVLGVVYSFFVLASVVAVDVLRGRRRWKLYLTVVASWLLLLPEKTSIVAAGRVGKPHFWTKAPKPYEILGAYTGASREILLVLVLLLCGAVWALSRGQNGFRANLTAAFKARRPLYAATVAVLLVPVWFLLEGLVGTWLFNDRYLQPVTLGVACLTAELLCLASGLPQIVAVRQRFPRLSLSAFALSSVLFAALTLVWVFHHVAQYTPEAPDFSDALTSRLPDTLPVVVEDAFTFTGLLSRKADSPVRYVFLLDWPYAISNDAPRLEVTQYHLMENWKLAGYYPDHIENFDSFLRTHPRFLVVHNDAVKPDPKNPKPEIGNPIAKRLSTTPGYEIHKYLTLDRLYRDSVRDTVWLVCRGGCAGSVPPPPREPNRCVLWSHGTDCCTGPACKLPEPQAPPHFWHISSWGK